MEIHPSALKMNTCEHCRYWDEEEVPFSWTDGSPYTFLRACKNLDLKCGDKEDGAFVFANSAHELLTGPKYGCVHWEPKGLQV